MAPALISLPFLKIKTRVALSPLELAPHSSSVTPPRISPEKRGKRTPREPPRRWSCQKRMDTKVVKIIINSGSSGGGDNKIRYTALH